MTSQHTPSRDFRKCCAIVFATLLLLGIYANARPIDITFAEGGIAYKSFIINYTDGSNMQLNISDTTQCVNRGGSLVVIDGDSEYEINPDQVENLTFHPLKKTVSGISDAAPAADITITVTRRELTATAPGSIDAHIYSLGGDSMDSAIGEGCLRLNLSHLHPGIYIAEINGRKIKIALK